MLRYSAGGVVVGPDGRVVIVNQNHDSWSLPKGKIEPGEDEMAAAKREIYEETGLTDIEILENLGSYERATIGRGGNGEDLDNMKHITFFLCRTQQTDLKPIDPENPAALWLAPEDIENKLHHPKDKEFYRQQLPKIARLHTKA